MRSSYLVLAALTAVSISVISRAATEENAEEFMQLHKVEIAFHEAGSTRNLNQMLSLFADDAVLTTIRKTDDGKEQIKTYTGKEQIKNYWQAHPAFQPQNQWVGYTPAFRIRYTVEGDRAHLYFECLWMDKAAGKIAAHTNSDDTLARVNGRWLIEEMKAASVPGLQRRSPRNRSSAASNYRFDESRRVADAGTRTSSPATRRPCAAPAASESTSLSERHTTRTRLPMACGFWHDPKR
ncbi:MAG: nuclear transport factor 2 family protein [Alphaproteobacteria bacterium]|nr:nuclear transport factor 2 family protein [Alphaproteobacteria bacterium]